jgi:hypothetical protein
MAERTADVQAHWTRPGVLARIDAALAELGQDPQILTPEILATVEHLHSGGLATTREQAKRIALQPSCCSRCTNAAVHGLQSAAELEPRKPMVGSFPACCARAASGHMAAAPPKMLMKSRRLM